MNGFLAVFTFVIVCLGAMVLYRGFYTARSLRTLASAELSNLKDKLQQRHLIVSHLLDALPASADLSIDRKTLSLQQTRSSEILEQIDPASPTVSEIQMFSAREQQFSSTINATIEGLEMDVTPQTDSLSACLEGLKEASAAIAEAAATYNAAAITYLSFLERPVARWCHPRSSGGEFGLVDLEVRPSSDSAQEQLA